ncbi:MAG TPA: class I SAM-dependent methyltransferase [Anaeromyxobacteraceae bacterium]|nr:class I SAM-dependent methyltransferase [Anaeromyxobacteraceae bacterium]
MKGLGRLAFLLRSRAPLWVIAAYYRLHLAYQVGKRLGGRPRTYAERAAAFARAKAGLELDHDWFTGNLPRWLWIFEKFGFRGRSEVRCLEIGSWQGLSAWFVLHELPGARITCVDTWGGADEHHADLQGSRERISNAERVFDRNLRPFADRVEKYRGTSLSWFASRTGPETFDLVYVDGSHHCDDVMVDAVKCFEMLAVGGVMIFDDYFWRYYEDARDNAAGAINAFLRLHRHRLRIVSFGHQLAVQKTGEASRAIGGASAPA